MGRSLSRSSTPCCRHPTWGDERPSEYTLELCRLLDNASTKDILKRIFVRSMSKRMQDAVSGCVDGTFDGLVQAADRAWALNNVSETTVAAVDHPTVTGGRASRCGHCHEPPSSGKRLPPAGQSKVSRDKAVPSGVQGNCFMPISCEMGRCGRKVLAVLFPLGATTSAGIPSGRD